MKHEGQEPIPQSTKNNIMKWIIFAMMGLIAASVAIILYWLYQPSDVIEFKQEPIPTRTIREHPTAGGVVILEVDYCKHVNAQGRVRTSFVSLSREVFLPIDIDNQSKRCLKTEIPILLPKDLPADTYKVHFRVEYTINPIKNVVEEFYSKEFTVVEPTSNL